MPPEKDGAPSSTTTQDVSASNSLEHPRLTQARNFYAMDAKYSKKIMLKELRAAGVHVPDEKIKKRVLERIFFKAFGMHFMHIAEERREERLKRVSMPNFDYIIVIDFECTCVPHAKNPADFDYFEIIEFPAVIIDVNRCCILSDFFHRYVWPARNVVTPYCTELTGITPLQIAQTGIPLKQALLEFHSWLADKGIFQGSEIRYAYAVDGHSDLGHFMQTSLKLSNIPFLHDFRRYIDVKTAFQHSGYSRQPVRLNRMLNVLNMTFDGRMHSGIDDAQNIAKVLLRLLQEGHAIDFTHKLVPLPLLAQYPESAHVKSKKIGYNKWMESSFLRPIALARKALCKGSRETCELCGTMTCHQSFQMTLA